LQDFLWLSKPALNPDLPKSLDLGQDPDSRIMDSQHCRVARQCGI